MNLHDGAQLVYHREARLLSLIHTVHYARQRSGRMGCKLLQRVTSKGYHMAPWVKMRLLFDANPFARDGVQEGKARRGRDGHNCHQTGIDVARAVLKMRVHDIVCVVEEIKRRRRECFRSTKVGVFSQESRAMIADGVKRKCCNSGTNPFEKIKGSEGWIAQCSCYALK